MGRLHTTALVIFAGGAFFVPLVLRMWWLSPSQTSSLAVPTLSAAAPAMPAMVAVSAPVGAAPSSSTVGPATDWASLWTQVIADRAPAEAVAPVDAFATPSPMRLAAQPNRIVVDNTQVSQAAWQIPTTLRPPAQPVTASPGWLTSAGPQPQGVQGLSIGTTQQEFGKFLIKLFAATAGVLTLCVVALRMSKTLASASSGGKRDLVIADAIAVSRDAGVKLIRVGNHQIVVGHDRNGLRGIVLLPAAFGNVLEDLRDAPGTHELYDGPISTIYSRARRQSFSKPEDQGWDLSQPIS